MSKCGQKKRSMGRRLSSSGQLPRPGTFGTKVSHSTPNASPPPFFESLEHRILLSSIYWVTTTSDSGAGSLRQAIANANASPGHDVIDFNIPGSGTERISLLSALPQITDPLTIDATTQPSYAGTILLEPYKTYVRPLSYTASAFRGNPPRECSILEIRLWTLRCDELLRGI